MPKLDEQISTLQNRLTQLKLRQQRSDARKHALEAQRERKLETRRRILVGALVMSKAQEGAIDLHQLRAWLDEALTRTDDRALFNLPARVTGPGPTGDNDSSQLSTSDPGADVYVRDVGVRSID